MNYKEALSKIAQWPDGGSNYGQQKIQDFANEVLKADCEQEKPVAWYLPSENGYDSCFRDDSTIQACTANPWTGWVPLYLRPQPAPGVAQLQADLERERQRWFEGNEQTSREHREEVKALVEALHSLERQSGLALMSDDPVRVKARAALAAYRIGGDAP